MHMKTNKISKLPLFVKILIPVLAFALLASAIIFYLFYGADPTKDYNPKYPLNDSGQSVSNTPESNSSDQPSKNPVSTNDKTSEDTPVVPTGSIAIAELEQSSGYVNARAVVSNFTAAQCVYSFVAENSRPVVREQQGDCSGVSISQNEFDKIGTYTLTVTAYNSAGKVEAKKDIYVR